MSRLPQWTENRFVIALIVLCFPAVIGYFVGKISPRELLITIGLALIVLILVLFRREILQIASWVVFVLIGMVFVLLATEYDLLPSPTPISTVEPTPSPTPFGGGGKIVYVSKADADGDGEIYMVDWNQNRGFKLTDADFDEPSPAWSPDGTQIVFVSDREGTDQFDQLFIMDAEPGSEPSCLTTSSYNKAEPAWGPDGKTIAYVANIGTSRSVWELYIVDVNSKFEQRLTFLNAGSWYPQWSPDGQEIAFFSNWESLSDPSRGRLYETYKLDLRQPHMPSIKWSTNNLDSDEYFIWSQDGKRYAFISKPYTADHNAWEIWAGDYDVHGSAQSITHNDALDGHPSWSPDGTKIVFHSSRDSGNSKVREIYIMDSNGGNPFNLSQQIEPNTIGVDHCCPNWSRP